MYHSIVLCDLIDLINLAGAFPGVIPTELDQDWRQRTRRMRAWLAALSHPDGEIAFFNDAAFGIAPTPVEIEAYAARCGLDPVAPDAQALLHLESSGYVRIVRGDCTLLADVGPIGPDYLPGHAHADSLSFELSLGRERVIVNGGTSQYGAGAGRQAERGTASHSTLEIDGQDSSEVWAGFRVARRARPFDLDLHEDVDAIRLTCAHDGYRRLPGRPVHRREWAVTGSGVRITDRVLGAGSHQAVVRFHLAPGVRACAEAGPGAAAGALVTSLGRRLRWICSVPMAIEPSVWRPQFGVGMPTVALAARTGGAEVVTELLWG